jgi:hypothetical protein
LCHVVLPTHQLNSLSAARSKEAGGWKARGSEAISQRQVAGVKNYAALTLKRHSIIIDGQENMVIGLTSNPLFKKTL